MIPAMSKMLDQIKLPDGLRVLAPESLIQVAEETREMILQTVSRTGGHLAANLGVVELTCALLHVFDAAHDKIIWDTSHQCYAFKILTDRKDRFHTLRQQDGISGFSKRAESPYDAFGAGHAGTALSAAMGMAVARDRLGRDEHVIAVVGDGAVGCGISFEALNNLSTATRRLIVILNDNEMSISKNVGALSAHFGKLLSNPRYNRWKSSIEDVAVSRLKMGRLRSVYHRMESTIKRLFVRSSLFEEFGLRYVGPIDGHDMHALVNALTTARHSLQPIVLHVSTRKGQGYAYAEEKPEQWHGIAPFDVESGAPVNLKKEGYSHVFGETLVRLAEQDSRIVAITAGMKDGTGLTEFAARFPDRFFDVGISEEHAVVFAAGLAAAGLRPVFAVYSTFAQRAVDCIIHDVCLQDLPVIFGFDRAGIVGDDGPTHHGVMDIPLCRSIPGLTMMQPRDPAELSRMLALAVQLGRPVAIRYPRGGSAPVSPVETPLLPGRAEVMRQGKDVAIWALGDMLPVGLQVADILAQQGMQACVVNPRFIRPLDTALLAQQVADGIRIFATIENGAVTGGFGSAVEESLNVQGFSGCVRRFGWPDEYIPQGSPLALFQQFGLSAESMAREILKLKA
jgi:1-deoxy-D-xylulose-5-phosphate synthase